jgi:hypothetical protein
VAVQGNCSPIFDALCFRKMLACVRLRDDFRAGRMQPIVAAGLIEMPVRVDKMGNGIGAEIGEGLGDLRTGSRDSGIDEELAIGSRQDGRLPPEPSRTLILFRSLYVLIGDTAALSLIRLTRPRASANASRDMSHPPVTAKAAPPGSTGKSLVATEIPALKIA